MYVWRRIKPSRTNDPGSELATVLHESISSKERAHWEVVPASESLSVGKKTWMELPVCLMATSRMEVKRVH